MGRRVRRRKPLTSPCVLRREAIAASWVSAGGTTRLDRTGNVWVYAADPRAICPEPVVPAVRAATTPHPSACDVRIQIVWPHAPPDGR